MTTIGTTEDQELFAFDDAELRFLRQTVSMQQGSLEARLSDPETAERERPRIKRNIRTAAACYGKLQHAINARLLGDEGEDPNE